MNESPVRLCCGQSHYGCICPDGLVMCCICFGRFEIKGLYVDQDGFTYDMCRDCGTWNHDRGG